MPWGQRRERNLGFQGWEFSSCVAVQAPVPPPRVLRQDCGHQTGRPRSPFEVRLDKGALPSPVGLSETCLHICLRRCGAVTTVPRVGCTRVPHVLAQGALCDSELPSRQGRRTLSHPAGSAPRQPSRTGVSAGG